MDSKLDQLAKLYCKFDELAKLRMSSMSWVSCTVSSMSLISCTVSSMSCGVSVSLSLSHWYPGSGVVLDCIDS